VFAEGRVLKEGSCKPEPTGWREALKGFSKDRILTGEGGEFHRWRNGKTLEVMESGSKAVHVIDTVQHREVFRGW